MWSDPEVETVLPGIHRVPVPLPSDGLKAVNVYMIEDGDGVTLIDSGWDGPLARAAIDRGLAVTGAELGDVKQMLITHMHYDHLGQATALRRAGAGAYWLGKDEEPSFNVVVTDPTSSSQNRLNGLARLGAAELAERRSGKAMARGPADWDPPDVWAGHGDEASTDQGPLRAIATPGHTRGHLCFHHGRRRVLFSGDHILPHITPSIGFEPNTNPMALVDFLRSLADVRALDVDMVLPAHGPVFADLAGRVDELVAHHDDRLAACVAALSTTGSSPYDVATQLPWTRRETDFADLDGFNQYLAVWETAAHLWLLASQETITVDETGDVLTFHPTPNRS